MPTGLILEQGKLPHANPPATSETREVAIVTIDEHGRATIQPASDDPSATGGLDDSNINTSPAAAQNALATVVAQRTRSNAILNDGLDDSHINTAPAQGSHNLWYRQKHCKVLVPAGSASVDLARWNALIADANVLEITRAPGSALLSPGPLGDETNGDVGFKLRSNLKVYHHPNANLVSHQVKGAFNAFHYYWLPLLDAGTSALDAAVAAAAGCPTAVLPISAASGLGNIAVGARVWAGQTDPGSKYVAYTGKVLSITGTGPWNVTCDEPCLWSLAAGTRVQVQTTICEKVDIDGYGSLLTGGADRMCQLEGVIDFTLKGFRGDQEAGYDQADYLFASDVGSRRGEISGMKAYNLVQGGIIEGGNQIFAERVHAINCTKGFGARDSIACGYEKFSSTGHSVFGVQFDASESGVHGCQDVSLKDGRLTAAAPGVGNAATGVQLSGRAAYCTVEDVWSEGHNINFDFGANATNARASKCTSKRALGASGFGAYANAPGMRLESFTSINDNVGVSAGAGGTIDVLEITNPQISGALVQAIKIDGAAPSGSRVNVRGGYVGGGDQTVDIIGPAIVLLDGTHVACTKTSSIAIYHRAAATPGVCIMRSVRISQGSGSSSGYTQSGAGVFGVIEGTHTNTCGTPLSIHASSELQMAPQGGVATQAFTASDVTLTVAQWQKQMLIATGLQTAKRKAIYPPIRGHVWTIDNRTTGGFAIEVSVGTGTTVDAPAGISRFVFDGTNMIAA